MRALLSSTSAAGATRTAYARDAYARNNAVHVAGVVKQMGQRARARALADALNGGGRNAVQQQLHCNG